MVGTIKDLLLNTVENHADGTAIRYKENGEWESFTYSELERRVQNVSELLNQLQFKSGERIGIQMPNNSMWPEIYFGIACSGFTAVPMDCEFGKEELVYILSHSECRAIFATTKTEHIIREVIDELPHLKTVILVGDESIETDGKKDAVFLDYREQIEKVTEKAASHEGFLKSNTPNEDDVASIIYTSGTTGRPKGVMLTHKNFCSNVEGCFNVVGISEKDNAILVLPLHHVFAFTANLLLAVRAGAEISIAESLRKLGQNIQELSPTILIAVPLLLEKMYGKIMKGLKQKRAAHLMFRLGIKKPIIRVIKKNLGGNLRLAISGGAPASADILRGFMSLGIPIVEGYGLTEASPVLTFNPPHLPRPGTAGKALPEVDIKIVDPNEQGIGEIAARGGNIMKGYLNDPDATAAVMSGEFLLTGDLGFIDDDDFITITGRKKSLIVSREGKNIYPEEVEPYINASPLVLESLVLAFTTPGETGEKVGLIVVPDQEAIAGHCGGAASPEEIESLMRAAIKEATSKLTAYKRPRKIQVRMEEFERTSSKKIKRHLYKIEADKA